jgi:hypothetical protein
VGPLQGVEPALQLDVHAQLPLSCAPQHLHLLQGVQLEQGVVAGGVDVEGDDVAAAIACTTIPPKASKLGWNS